MSAATSPTEERREHDDDSDWLVVMSASINSPMKKLLDNMPQDVIDIGFSTGQVGQALYRLSQVDSFRELNMMSLTTGTLLLVKDASTTGMTDALLHTLRSNVKTSDLRSFEIPLILLDGTIVTALWYTDSTGSLPTAYSLIGRGRQAWRAWWKRRRDTEGTVPAQELTDLGTV